MFDIDTDKLARLFNGEIVEEDNFDDAMEENEYEPPEQEQTIQETKNQAQPIANGSLPPSAIREKKRAREDDLDTISEKKRPREDDTETETGKRIRSGDEPTAAPIVADTFEQETSREVVNAPGLQAAAPTEGENITLSHQVRHQVAVPPNYNYIPISQHVPPEEPARTYSFTLDPFQRVAISSIERNESVLVSAHTSAGKTVVAEYAIAQCLKNKQRVIYTSPIKALSNQKYREFAEKFRDVGLITGDVTLSPEASCLVMTTEILRSMLYRGSVIMREVAWVIFDEIHYMRDSERGVVWEESIILLPDAVRYVFLSATIPNAMEFAEWICKIHAQPCHIVYTDFRPTPLQHYLFPADSEGIHLVVDERGGFREQNFQRAIAALSDAAADDPSGPTARGGRGKKGPKTRKNGGKDGNSDIQRIIKMIMVKGYHPVIVFSFSKRECEAYALQLSKVDFNDKEDHAMVDEVFKNATASLSEEDRRLPQIQQLLPLLRRGIGVHHGGLLPLMKEVIEILFQEGYIKVLFATETFSIGLNMPAKTVVFTSVRKFDGKQTRWVTSGEYIQMSGRAGRRGLDARGIVIMMIDEKMEPEAAKNMVKGESDPMNSAFHLSYNMILNLLRIEGYSPEYMLQRCFYTFQNSIDIPQYERELAKLEAEKDAMVIPREEEIKHYYELRQQHDKYTDDFHAIISHPQYCLPFMQPGRLVHIVHNDMDFGWAVVLEYHRVKNRGADETQSDSSKYIVDVLLHCSSNSNPARDAEGNTVGLYPPAENEKGTLQAVPVLLSTVQALSRIRLQIPKDVKSSDARKHILASMREVHRRLNNNIPKLHPVDDMNIRGPEFEKVVERLQALEAVLKNHPLHEAPDLPELYNAYHEKLELGKKIKAVKQKITDAESIIHLQELKARKRVLRRLGFTSQADIVELKGRVACEISSGDELLLTEMLFQNVFSDLSAAQSVALLSCFVFDERVDDAPPRLIAELEGPLQLMRETARRIAQVSKESKMIIDEDEYVQKFNPYLMDAVYAWCRGATFQEICKTVNVYEGSIIRMFRRLDELLRQMHAAAKCIGNQDMEVKFAEGVSLIHRDIIFAASLYL